MVRDNIFYDFLQDGHFAELKNTEMLRERLNLAREVRDYVGKYYSVNYVRRNILRQTETEIKKWMLKSKKKLMTVSYHHQKHKYQVVMSII